ncbi:fasciclin domain-containing protein [Belliella sp. DSM 107340]|uniref:Fasciclin domain-containing protein n=1 Tax=Belliella calami TaxID=2923436 RepID=A0ABS9UM27_9BACT|nr:fasciclin domain-containing protein [Belliella calami]MCH7397682.1 fasciclin domain-containing protein [Belliella calami]
MKKKSLFNWNVRFPLAALALGFGLVACNDDDDTDPIIETNNVVEVAAANPEFSTLTAAIETAELVPTLSGDGPFTVFAPNDEAFGRFLSANGLSADELLANPELGDILTYHVISGNVASADVEPGRVNTLGDAPFFVSQAPDDSFWINGNAKIEATDVSASNGVIHVLDNVITAPTQNIAEIATALSTSDSPQFTQLVAALVRADLVETFMGGFDDDYTVFAPTDAAFEALYDALGVNGVDEIELGLLTDVLKYHVVEARRFSQDLRQDAVIETMLDDATLTVDLANMQINDASLDDEGLVNIHATNGVIHVIDQVLLPPTE